MEKIKEVIWGASFRRAFKKFSKKDPNFAIYFREFFEDFCNNPNNSRFGLHKLKGRLSPCLSVKIKYDLRLIFKVEKKQIILVDIGTHDKVY